MSKSPARRWLRHAPPVLGGLLLLGAVYVVQKEFRHLKLDDIAAALTQIPRDWLLAGGCFAVLAYGILSLYDLLGTIFAGAKLAYRRVLFTSFCAYALSHNLGFSAVSGAAVRFRLYANWGLTPLQIGKLVALCSVTFGFGGLTVAGAALLFEPHAMPFVGNTLPVWLLHLVGVAMWAAVGAYLTLAARQHQVTLFGHIVRPPSLAMAIGQVVLASTDLSVTSSIFYALLPHGHGLTFFKFIAVYVMSYSAGVVASLPGGIGVFDTVMLLGLATYMPAARVVGGLLIFRLYYYVIPLFLAGMLFAGHEILSRGRSLLRGRDAPAIAQTRRSESDFAIAAGTGAVGLCGVMLLALGVIGPTVDTSWIDPDYAAGVVTAGHFVPSLIGAALLIFAIGLSQRVALAWGGTIVLLLLGAAVTAFQAHNVWIPLVLVATCFVLAPYRRAFARHARLLNAQWQPATAMQLFALIGCVLALAVFERHVRFVASNSWWNIVVSPLLPNSVRLAVGLSVLVGGLTIWQLLKPSGAAAAPWTMEARMRFAALGGKPPARADGIVHGEAGRAALPFRRLGELLIGLGDPAGLPTDRASAIWRLQAVARKEGRGAAFYRVGPDLLDVYGALGFAALPLCGNGLPIGEGGANTGPGGREPTAAWLMCRNERDMARLLPALPALAGHDAIRAA